jgi:DNA polymerase-3 subunit delta'
MLGANKQWKLLESMALGGDLPHALLFSGQEQLGKKSIALEFAKIVCPNISYPDLICMEAREIKDIRELIWKLSLKPYNAPIKIALIDNAHLMNSESQNCFLKTLEEPKGKVLMILITSYPEMLLSTILSRVQQIKFFPVDGNEIRKYLIKSGESEERAEHISSLSLGRPGRAMELASDNDKIEECEKIIADLKKITASDLGVRFQYAKKVLADEDSGVKLKDILESWLNYFRKMMLDKIKDKSKGGYSILRIKNIINKIQTIHYLVSTTNVNQKLALEIVMMEI